MKKVVHVVLLLLGLGSFSFAGELVVLKADGKPYEGRVVVQGWGPIQLTGGKADVFVILRSRAEVLGVNAPSELDVFIPPSGKSCGQLVRIQDGTERVVRLVPAVEFGNDYVVRSIYGPEIMDIAGRPLEGVSIWLDGYHQVGSTSSSGTISLSMYVPKELQSVMMVLYKDGYELKTIKVKLPPYVSPDNPGKFAATSGDIRLDFATNQILTLTVTNFGVEVYKDVQFSQWYARDAGTYLFAFMAKDSVHGAYAVTVPLFEGMSLTQGTANLHMLSAIVGEEVQISDLPKSLPRVLVINKIKVSRPKQAAPTVVYDTGYRKVDPLIVGILVFVLVGLTVALVSFFVSYLRDKSKERKAQAKQKETREFRKKLEFANAPQDAEILLNKAGELVENNSLDGGNRQIVRQCVIQIHSLLDDIRTKSKLFMEVFERIVGHRELRKIQLVAIRDCSNESAFGLAFGLKKLYDESEVQEGKLAESQDKLKDVIAARKKAVQSLFATLRSLNKRCQLLLQFSHLTDKMTDLQETIATTMASVQESFAGESTAALDPATLVEKVKLLKRAGNIGVETDQITELQEFLTAHKE